VTPGQNSIQETLAGALKTRAEPFSVKRPLKPQQVRDPGLSGYRHRMSIRLAFQLPVRL
jgi:hypothetical protein